MRFITVISLLTALLFIPTNLLSQANPSPDDLAQESLRFTRTYQIVEQNYLSPINPDQTIFNGAIRGMLSTLDPFSAFFDPDQFELLQQQARGEALGFGSILYVQPGKILVLQTAQGSPSWRAGLGPGDEIVSVNGQRIAQLDLNDLVQLLQRSRSQPVRLGVIHPGHVVAQDFDLKPAQVALPTVDKSFLLSSQIGYIHLNGFEGKSPQEIIDTLKGLDSMAGQDHQTGHKSDASGSVSNLHGLLLDLRDNRGGMVDAAVGVMSLFLKPNLVALTVKGRNAQPSERTYETFSTSFYFGGPLIVLVNENTASAAEVVTAALQDHDRAVIAGEPTFGKGVVETVMGLSEKTGLALTTAQYFTPSGRSIQKPLVGTALALEEAASATTPPPVPTSSGPGPTPAAARSSKTSAAFHTDNGRPVSAGGGVTPDVTIPPRSLDPWVEFLNQRGAFTDFASEYLTLPRQVDKNFEPDSETLNTFKDFLTRHGIRAPQEYWASDQAYLKLRIRTEVLDLVFGLALGEEVETRSDPQVQKALTLFAQIPAVLEGATLKAAAH